MKKTLLVIGLILMVASGQALAARGGQTKIANGPFNYTPGSMGSVTYLGNEGAPLDTGFQLCAPTGGTIFPAGGDSADVEIRVFGIEKVADASGNPVEAEEIPLDSPLGALIAGAFDIDPASYIIYPGECVDIDISVSNPGVTEADFGDYVVVVKAQSIGSGIGVGSGSRFNLGLREASESDNVPPTVTIDQPADGSSLILGPVTVEITATDPAPGSGLGSGAVNATIMSAGNTVNQTLFLTDDGPKDAGYAQTATGSFTPTGGTGTEGTWEDPFSSTYLSGIGTYTISATATDLAGNTSPAATSTFDINYNVVFTKNHFGGKNAQFQFTVNRSSTTSDGAFMVDQTVVVKLIKTDAGEVEVDSHSFGTGSPHENVKIDTTSLDEADWVYKTNFKTNTSTAGPGQYKAEVWFKDVDNNDVKQGESEPISRK